VIERARGGARGIARGAVPDAALATPAHRAVGQGTA
jgi:hypothetical protein